MAKKICSKCMTVEGCFCLNTDESIKKTRSSCFTKVVIWSKKKKTENGSILIRFKKTKLPNGFEIPSGFEFWFWFNELVDESANECTFANVGLNRMIKDIQTKRLKGLL